ncbi:Ger(x)C family spore germination protein [Virgibacillus dakarensis]|uniref:Uncharacterized protein n=1 Tax=Lentibacillus populi TaxID=1827502 RepID=A0A9W5X7E9_9BACI|nr:MULTISPECIES: Ger(x)C family spore germination protein [Bacillaceae]MTW87007.1 Ger(x)C family spore germination protein [Virgibacillus dakarensis]GGB56021.1 hypothetical protein GCM10011409_37020 [Lentibacillus populi]
MKKLIVLASIIVLSGCVQPRTIEDMGIILTRGVDKLEDNNIETTISYFEFNAQQKEYSNIVTGRANTIKQARIDANRKTDFRLTPGSSKLEVYGRETAEKGVLRYLDTLIRDARVSDTMLLAISDTTAKELLYKAEKHADVNTGLYLHYILERNILNNVIPRVNLQDFLRFYFDKGQDPFLPILSISNDKPVLSSLALFQDDKMVGQLPIEKAYLIGAFHKDLRDLFLEVALPSEPFKGQMRTDAQSKNETGIDKFFALLTVLNSKSKSKITDIQKLKFRTEVTFDVSLMELTEEIKLNNPKVVRKLEKEVEKEIKKQYEQLLAKLQELNTDPLGYGTIYRINKPNGELKEGEWYDYFPDIHVDYHVNVRIFRHGTER